MQGRIRLDTLRDKREEQDRVAIENGRFNIGSLGHNNNIQLIDSESDIQIINPTQDQLKKRDAK